MAFGKIVVSSVVLSGDVNVVGFETAAVVCGDVIAAVVVRVVVVLVFVVDVACNVVDVARIAVAACVAVVASDDGVVVGGAVAVSSGE